MNIFILEDDLLQQQKLERLIRNILARKKWLPRSIFKTAKPRLLLETVETTQGKNIYFLDIEIKNEEKKGLETARAIRKLDPYGIIIFVTTHSEFAPMTYRYKVSALEFIDKNEEDAAFQEQIEDCLAVLFNPANQLVAEEAFAFENKQTHFQVPFHTILYFETSEISHKVRLIGKNRISEFYATLDEIEKTDRRLFKCHRSFVINLANVESINRTENIVSFGDGIDCLISRRKTSTATQLMKEINQ
ncbi:DNA-binding response regulator [Enterococcus florum]|uniref:DNA-binding response regulator n=1 Tax=Enterococcus florum TaxID=2480627 RepID=A0A4P5PC59_9ENTE|nr:response regulator transcription factor [Enterococcus florum]GCF95660.1 DNA-binding response regulator [Enterococcus florum]